MSDNWRHVMGVEFRLEEAFRFGTASAAPQIEGGDAKHTWNAWADAGHIKDGSSPRRAGGHLKHTKEDADLMKKLGLQISRISVEWSRIEPEEGQFDETVLASYKEEIDYMRGLGIETLVTLHHFSDPVWFAANGGFEEPGNIDCFLRFVEKTVRYFGASVCEYVTINEPNVYAFSGYYVGEFPPGKKSLASMNRVMSVTASAHIEAYLLIHRIRGEMGLDDTSVGFANHLRVFVPKNPKNPAHRALSVFNEWMFQGALSRAALLGDFRPPLTRYTSAGRGKYSDFLGLNYYSRSSVSGLSDGTAEGEPVNDLGWEIYPPGIVICARKLFELLPAKIYVTENGTCDNDDRFRIRYIYDHLREIAKSPLPFARYYHWCFTDNFEWLEGESARFGIVHTDFDSEIRTVKRSGEFYAELIRERGISAELYDKYVKGILYDA